MAPRRQEPLLRRRFHKPHNSDINIFMPPGRFCYDRSVACEAPEHGKELPWGTGTEDIRRTPTYDAQVEQISSSPKMPS